MGNLNPSRWRQVTTLFHAALTRDTAGRQAFLQDACGNDASLRAEVEALLSAQRKAGSLFADTLPRLAPGTPFGQYRLEALIGAGGMGQVYRATDTRLRRQVAIKLLVPGLADDPDFAPRFEREGRLLASLNHPNIAAIYGLEEADGVHGLVLELVEGQTLAERLNRGALPVTEALAIARQIASALDAAHERGIIHRDLKPANIKITPPGVVKVLDFGIARAIDTEGDTAGETTKATRTGVVLGTPAYMSPEQARGQPVDKRADIWAFGCVLYEMLTGRSAFAGDTASDTVAHVLEREPAWDAIPAGVPPAILRLIRRCLQKDPRERIRDSADVRLEIVDALSTPDRHPIATPSRRVGWLWAGGALIALLAAGSLIVWLSRSQRSLAPAALEFPINLPPNAGNAGYGLAVSPDGRHVAFAMCCGGPQVWVYSLDSAETRPIPGTDEGRSPFWSSDSSSIGFFAAGKIKRTDLHGGPPVEVADITALPSVQIPAASWNADGVILFSTGIQLFRVPAFGGTVTALSLVDDAGEAVRTAPQFLPDGSHFLYFAQGPLSGAIYLASLETAQATRLTDSESPATYSAPSHLMYVRGTALVAQTLDLKSRRVEGEALLVAPDADRGCICPITYAHVSASSNDVVAFVPLTTGSPGHLTWFDRAGKALGSIDQPEGVEYLNPAVSPDGEQVAFNHLDRQTGNWDVWIEDVARRTASPVTSNPAFDADPVWSPDGKEVVFASNRDGGTSLYRTAVGRSGAEQLLAHFDGAATSVVPTDWSSDDRYVLFQISTQAHPVWEEWALPLTGDGKPVAVLRGGGRKYAGRLSPDRKWIAYVSFETKFPEVWVERFMSPGDRRQISQGGGTHPRWTRDGRELVYWADPGRGGLAAVDLEFTDSGSARASRGPSYQHRFRF